jgi:proline iminopeptidase
VSDPRPVHKDPLTWLYPEVEPHSSGRLDVSPLHSLYWEESGNPHGKPVVFLHGGPGANTEPRHRRFFDPRAYRIILFDQRGCGQSTPRGEVRDNTTAELINDLELIRVNRGIERWQVFGGSWGSTLALSYALAYPHRVTELVLRGLFLATSEELAWANEGGVAPLVPWSFQRYRDFLPPEERGQLLHHYTRRVLHPDAAISLPAAREWTRFEESLAGFPALEEPPEPITDEALISIARLEAHYFANGCFLERPILPRIDRLRHIPAVLVHGRYDLVCPIQSAWKLAHAWPELDFVMIPEGGHLPTGPLSRALVAATDRFKPRVDESVRRG